MDVGGVIKWILIGLVGLYIWRYVSSAFGQGYQVPSNLGGGATYYGIPQGYAYTTPVFVGPYRSGYYRGRRSPDYGPWRPGV